MATWDEGGTDRASVWVVSMVMALLLVVGLAIGGGVVYLVWAREGTPTTAPDTCERDRTVNLTVAPELSDVVALALAEAAPECVQVRSTTRSGGEVALGVSMGGALPDIWIPESRFWLNRAYLGAAAQLRTFSPSLARTPLMLVGGRRGPRFASWGEAEVSGLVSVPDPQVSTVGALAVVAPQAEARATGRTIPDARQMVVPFAQTYGARRARGDDLQVWPTMFSPLSRRLVVTTEQEFSTVQGGHVRDLTPAVGAPVLEFPLAVRADAPSGSRAVARSLVAYVASEAGSAVLRQQDLRPGHGPTPPGTPSGVSTYLPTPPAAAVVAAVQSWKTLAVPSAMLVVVDASGSMDFDAGTGTRMDLLADAAGIGLSFLPGHARVGLWVFSIDKGGPGQDWRVLEPIQRLDSLRFGRTQRYALRQWAREMPGLTGGGTGLYDTALAAYREAVRSYRPNYSNALVLMTDGRNEDPGSVELDELLARLRELRDPDRPVRIVGIAISEDADLAALQQMAQVTGGEAYPAAEPQDILGVFARAVLSR